MGLSFLPDYINEALGNLNFNFVSELRLRKRQPVLVEYKGEYKFLTPYGVSDSGNGALVIQDIYQVLNSATNGCVYRYSEQMKNGFITVGHGIRIGIAGEYVTQDGRVKSVTAITSLNIRIPHDVSGRAEEICERLYKTRIESTLIYSSPGLGKTTLLRSLTRILSEKFRINVLVFDERSEISAMDGEGNGYDLGVRVDVVRCNDKKSAISAAVRAMKPALIVTDELYGEEDERAVKYAVDCGIKVIASSHITDKKLLANLPFTYFVELIKIGAEPNIYDKNFALIGDSCADDVDRGISVG